MPTRARCRAFWIVALGAALGCGNDDEPSRNSHAARDVQQNAEAGFGADASGGMPSDSSEGRGAGGMPSDSSEGRGAGGTNAASNAAAAEPPSSGGTNAASKSAESVEPLGTSGRSGASSPDPATVSPSSVGTAADRVVAIGDLHSDIAATRSAFQLAGATNEADEWIGGSLTIVQLGDLIDRGEDERQVLDFIFDLRKKAEAGGGRLYNLVGNHEVMAARVDNQSVGVDPFPGFEDLADLVRDDPRLQILPENQRARGAALIAGGPIARRFAEFPTVLRIGQTIFVHAGIAPRWAEYGIDNINREVSQWLMGNTAEPDCSLGVDDGDRVMWTRQFSSAVDNTDCAALTQSLSILGAKRMIVGHTVQSTLGSWCDGRLWTIDVGMARYYGGPVEVLELIDDEALTVLRYHTSPD